MPPTNRALVHIGIGVAVGIRIAETTRSYGKTVTTPTEKRRFTRMPFNRPAMLDGPSGVVNGRLRDISLNGARLDLTGAWRAEPGARYRLMVDLAPGTRVRMDLQLVHRRGTAAGFRCDRLSDSGLRHLKQLLTLYHGDAAAMQREAARMPTRQSAPWSRHDP